MHSCTRAHAHSLIKMVRGMNRDFGIYDPLDFLAAVTAHIPNRWEHMVRYYGWYSSVRRGERRKAGLEKPGLDLVEVVEDLGHSDEGNRYYCIGKIDQGILTVRFTYRGNVIRIYGAGYWRKGRKIYEEEN